MLHLIFRGFKKLKLSVPGKLEVCNTIATYLSFYPKILQWQRKCINCYNKKAKIVKTVKLNKPLYAFSLLFFLKKLFLWMLITLSCKYSRWRNSRTLGHIHTPPYLLPWKYIAWKSLPLKSQWSGKVIKAYIPLWVKTRNLQNTCKLMC